MERSARRESYARNEMAIEYECRSASPQSLHAAAAAAAIRACRAAVSCGQWQHLRILLVHFPRCCSTRCRGSAWAISATPDARLLRGASVRLPLQRGLAH